MRRILVTGGAGFVGSHIAAHLKSFGDDVTVFDAMRSATSPLFIEMLKSGDVRFSQVDLLDRSALRYALSEHTADSSFDAVVHCAANSDTRLALTDRDTDFNDGIIASRNILEELSCHTPRRLLFLSSQHVYGQNRHTDEAQELRPISAYGAAKAAVEMLIRYYVAGRGLEARVLRCSNLVGRGQRYGVLPEFIDKLVGTREPVRLLAGGHQRRSFLHVSDAARAVGIFIHSSLPWTPSLATYNVAALDTITVSEVLSIVQDVTGNTSEPEEISSPKQGEWQGDLGSVSIPISRITSLGWQPRYSSREAIALATEAILQDTSSQLARGRI